MAIASCSLSVTGGVVNWFMDATQKGQTSQSQAQRHKQQTKAHYGE
jgi:hypothetical protein